MCLRAWALTLAVTSSTVALGTGFWPTTAAGACSQRPMQGAAMTRTSWPRIDGSFASRSLAPALSQEGPSQTRTVNPAGGVAAFLDDVEVVVEGSDFVHFRLRQLHLGGQGRQVARGQAVEGVLNLVQMFDQHVGRARAVAQQGAHFFERSQFDPAALGCFALALAAGAFDFDGDDHLVHAVSPVSGPGGPIRTTLVGVVSIKTPGGLAARPVSLAVYFRAVLRSTALYC